MSHRRWMAGAVLILSAALVLTGCESLRRKFVRVKKSDGTKETMVITPRDYSAHPFSNDILYKQYFTYWKSWNQELVRSLGERASHKKILDCVEQCLLNLDKMKTYLNDDESAKLDVFRQKTDRLKKQVESQPNILPAQADLLKYDADRILSGVNRQFDGRKMKDAIKPSGDGA